MKTCYNSKEAKGPINHIERWHKKGISSFLKLRDVYPKAGGVYSSCGKNLNRFSTFLIV